MRGWKVWSVLALLLAGCAVDEGAPEDETPPSSESTQQSHARLAVEGVAQDTPQENAATTATNPTGINPGAAAVAAPGEKPQPDPWKNSANPGDNPNKPQPDPWRNLQTTQIQQAK